MKCCIVGADGSTLGGLSNLQETRHHPTAVVQVQDLGPGRRRQVQGEGEAEQQTAQHQQVVQVLFLDPSRGPIRTPRPTTRRRMYHHCVLLLCYDQ